MRQIRQLDEKTKAHLGLKMRELQDLLERINGAVDLAVAQQNLVGRWILAPDGSHLFQETTADSAKPEETKGGET